MPDFTARLKKLEPLGTVALVPGSSLRYFTGLDFHLSERPLVFFMGAFGMAAIVPELEASRINARADLDVVLFTWRDDQGYEAAFQAAIDGLHLAARPLGVDGMTMRVTELLTLQKLAPNMSVRPVEHDLIAIRAHKDAAEVAALRHAIAISERALASLFAQLEVGLSERALAGLLTDALVAEGSQGASFSPLVQLGENSAFPHGNITERELRQGDIVLIDFGAMYQGYPADITRTVCFGEPPAAFPKMFAAVLAANEAAIAASKPGVPMQEVDRAARRVIEDAGYGEYFIHRTGHGLGLDVHEPIPQIAEGVEWLLEPGMVFTIEPGVYIPGIGGVRLEDDVLVTEQGLEVLTSFPKVWQLSDVLTKGH
jgi:Xaa-Pro dipeptidase